MVRGFSFKALSSVVQAVSGRFFNGRSPVSGLPGCGRRARAAALFGLVALTSAPAAAWAQAMPPELQKVWQAAKLPDAAFSLYVQEIGGPVLMAVNAGQPRNPASVMKLVTTWGALAGLGPNYTWRTAFYTDPGARIDEQGTLKGPLYLKAGADPNLTAEELWGLLRELRLRGVKNVTDVVVDRSVFGAVAIDPSEFDGAGDRPYNASPDAMMVGLGVVRLVFQPDRQARRWIPLIDPPVPGLRIAGDVAWSDAVCPGSPGVVTQVSSAGADATITVSGQAAGSCGEFSVYRLVQPQQRHFETTFQMLWRELGGTLGKGFREGKVPGGATLLTWRDSEPLSEAIRWVNKQSNNVMARTLLLTLAAETQGAGATVQSGMRALQQVLNGQGVNTTGWVFDNGSGLSREGRVTAQGLGGMLLTAWNSPLMPEFVSSLAISGVDGTVRRRLKADEVRGMAHLKTGSLRDVRALAGYVLGASGKRYVLVSMVNHERAAAGRPFDDALVKWLAAR